jgi:NitT/TauT family transport system permease protein
LGFFALRGTLDKQTQAVVEIAGVLCLIFLWYLVCSVGGVPPTILPSPWSVLACVPELHFQDAMVRNLGYSMYLNIAGYLEAVVICVPLGFMIGLFPLCKGLFNKQVDAIRFIPLTAITGLFIVWFGIEDMMKVQFLAFGIIVYLLPVVVQRVGQVEEVYQQTAFTLGASTWQTIRTVFFPGVFSKLFDDIRVLVAISWTYIIVAEMVNKTGGIGALLYSAARQSRIDKVFALLFLIVLVGFIQDKIFKVLDTKLFPYKVQTA